MTAFKSTDPWQSFVDEGWAIACAETGFTSEDQCATVLDARSIGNGTVGEAIAALAERPQSIDLIRWISGLMLDRLQPEAKATLLDALGRFDPAYAGVLYMWRADLTDEEDAILFDAFQDELPMLVKKLAVSDSDRAKVKAVG